LYSISVFIIVSIVFTVKGGHTHTHKEKEREKIISSQNQGVPPIEIAMSALDPDDTEELESSPLIPLSVFILRRATTRPATNAAATANAIPAKATPLRPEESSDALLPPRVELLLSSTAGTTSGVGLAVPAEVGASVAIGAPVGKSVGTSLGTSLGGSLGISAVGVSTTRVGADVGTAAVGAEVGSRVGGT
jgi:hypothetical protein